MTQANGEKLDLDELLAAIAQCNGNATAVARKLHVCRATICNYQKRYANVKHAFAAARESMKDNVESVLYEKALAGESWAVCFFLKTQAKDRGYIERTEMSGPEGGPITLRVVYENRPDAGVSDQPANSA
jgi:hypothetical protein